MSGYKLVLLIYLKGTNYFKGTLHNVDSTQPIFITKSILEDRKLNSFINISY